MTCQAVSLTASKTFGRESGNFNRRRLSLLTKVRTQAGWAGRVLATKLGDLGWSLAAGDGGALGAEQRIWVGVRPMCVVNNVLPTNSSSLTRRIQNIDWDHIYYSAGTELNMLQWSSLWSL